MKFPTEYRIFIDRETEIYGGIINKYVVNIKKSNKNKEVKTMLENEKVSKLEQLNSLKGEYERKLEELKAKDINSLIEIKVAEVREQISNDVVAEHEELIAKTEIKIEAINEMIADVEAIEVETPVDEVVEVEVVAEAEAPVDEVPADNAETQF